eukprot:PhM_4_TR9797/c0_g1_i1/m.63022/K02554/mhpD; 2-keto-4-pentenoate hydratase
MLFRSLLRRNNVRATPATAAAAKEFVTTYFRPIKKTTTTTTTPDAAPAPVSKPVTSLLPTQAEGMSEGYAFQDYVIECLEDEELYGDTICGWRVKTSSSGSSGTTSQESFCGPIMESMLIQKNDSTVSLQGTGALDFEIQLAFEITEDVPADVSMVDCPKYVGKIYPVLEITGNRLAPTRAPSTPCLVADCAGAGRVILGEAIERSVWDREGSTLTELQAVLLAGEEPVAVARCSEVVGTPFAAVKFLARHLPTRKRSLGKGMIVSTGSWCSVNAFVGHVGAHFGPFGLIRVNVTP